MVNPGIIQALVPVVLGVNTGTLLVVASLGDGLRVRARHRKGYEASLTGAGGNCTFGATLGASRRRMSQ